MWPHWRQIESSSSISNKAQHVSSLEPNKGSSSISLRPQIPTTNPAAMYSKYSKKSWPNIKAFDNHKINTHLYNIPMFLSN